MIKLWSSPSICLDSLFTLPVELGAQPWKAPTDVEDHQVMDNYNWGSASNFEEAVPNQIYQ